MKPSEAILAIRKHIAFKPTETKASLDLLLDRIIRYSATYGNKDFRQAESLEQEVEQALNVD